jgi:ATP-binding cassette subfamily F protein uup
MAFLFRCDSLGKSYGSRQLFRDISISFEDGERTGLIGPNGSGKSTLLKILAGLEQTDEGTLTIRRNIRLGYVPQADVFTAGATVRDVLRSSGTPDGVDEHDMDVKAAILMDKIGFNDPDQEADSLSGGWRKRLAIARQLIRDPDVVLFDEPTNHLDLEGIEWLERVLATAPFAFLLCSHDRYFLQATTNRTVELSTAYANGFLSVPSPYTEFLVKKEEYLVAQASLETSVAGKVRRELEWLSRGAQARSTKAKGRIQQAGELVDELKELKTRNTRQGAAGVDFVGSERQTRRLLAAEKVSKKMGDRLLFKDVGFTLGPGDKLGLVGPNGSGKTTLIKLMTNQLQPDSGQFRRADGLRVVVFDQARQALEQNQTLKQALSPGGESLQFRGQTIHVSSWAQRFLFRSQQLDMAVRDLSGGEQARILIARLMLQPADVLILDEPTNDLDIASLEVLETSLADFPGALVLVTHDRYMLDRLATEMLGLDGKGNAAIYPDRNQYERARLAANKAAAKAEKAQASPVSNTPKPKPKGLSYMEQREWDAIEEVILAAEVASEKAQMALGAEDVMADRKKMLVAAKVASEAQAAVEKLYARWQELDAKKNG